jgi:hypothetical protein
VASRSGPTWEELEKKGPKGYDDSDDFGYKEFKRKLEFNKNYGWSVPVENAIKEIKKFISGRNVLEVGSGLGLWAKLLIRAGVHMTPTDNYKSHGTEEALNDKWKQFTHVEKIKGEEAVEKYSDHSVLFFSWPPYDNPLAYKALKKFKGDSVIYIGENRGGCTAGNSFYDELENRFSLVGKFSIPRWEGIYDFIGFWNRKI